MPFENNKGICVLTHTNVAINEIKNNLGDSAKLLLSYPNFVGTIQSFIDKYLAIPASIIYCGTRPARIVEDDEYKWRLIKKFKSLYQNPKHSKLSSYLYRILDASIKSSKNWSVIKKAKEDILCSLRMDYQKAVILRNIKGNERVELPNPNTDSYKEYCRLISSLIKDGVLSYNDAYGLALKYINDYGHIIKPLFSERFSFIFVDEMQDTNSLQLAILDELFDKDKIVFQCFGDPKQSIYDFLGQDGAWTPVNPLYITNSKRFNNNIAKVSDCISLEPYNMKGTGDSEIPPIVITYSDNDVSKVLENFARIILYYNLQTEEKSIFKAVGMVKENEKLCIKDYHLAFNKIIDNQNFTRDFSTLNMYLTKMNDDIILSEGVKVYYNRFINAILKVLRLSDTKTNDGKFFSKTEFLKYLKESDERLYIEMNRIFARCIMFIENGKDVTKHFRNLVIILLKRLFNEEQNSVVKDFLNNICPSASEAIVTKANNNIYEFNGIKIEIDTVHGVKGQTHTATLYLDTFNYTKAVENIIEYLIDGPKKKTGTIIERHLKIAYVAMTRPQKLLCITMEDAVFEQNKDKLVEKGWVKYDEILKNESVALQGAI
jgi:superfamily I DNA/RNA helicase